MITSITTHANDAVARLIEQYKNSPLLIGLVRAFVHQPQQLEDVFNDLARSRTLDGSLGQQLDNLGKIVGQTRKNSQSDADYLVSIKTRIVQNLSNGEIERLIQVYQVLMGADQVYLGESFPAAINLMSEVPIADQATANSLIDQIKQIDAGGVRVEYVGSFDSSHPFSFDGPLIGFGFGDLNDSTIGGLFATLYTKYLNFSFDGSDPTTVGLADVRDSLVGGYMVSL